MKILNLIKFLFFYECNIKLFNKYFNVKCIDENVNKFLTIYLHM